MAEIDAGTQKTVGKKSVWLISISCIWIHTSQQGLLIAIYTIAVRHAKFPFIFQWNKLKKRLHFEIWASTFSMKTFFSSKAVQNRVRQEVFEQLQVDKQYAGQEDEPCFSFKVVADMFSKVFKKYSTQIFKSCPVVQNHSGHSSHVSFLSIDLLYLHMNPSCSDKKFHQNMFYLFFLKLPGSFKCETPQPPPHSA